MKLSPSPSLATFGCPELCHIIARYLDRTDLYRCLLVYKTVSKNLLPYLWRHISFSDWVPYYSEFYYLDKQQKQQEEPQLGDQAFKDETSSSATPAPKHKRKERPHISYRGIPNPWATAPQDPLQDDSDLYFPPQPPYSSLILHGHLIQTLSLEWDEGEDFLPKPEMTECSEPEEPPGLMQTWIYIRLLKQCPNVRALKIVGRNTELPWVRPKWMWCGTEAGLEEIFAKNKRREAKDRSLAKIIRAAGQVGRQQLLSKSSLAGEGEEGTEAQVEARAEARGQGIQEFYLSNSCGFNHESFKALIEAFSSPTPHPTTPALIAASQSRDDSLLSSSSTQLFLPRRPQFRVLDISACQFILSSHMDTLLTQFSGLQVVDFRCREYLTELFVYSGFHYNGSYDDEISEQQVEDRGKDEDGSPVLKPMVESSGSDGQMTAYKGWTCGESLRVLRIGISSVTMRDQRRRQGPFISIPAPVKPGEGPFEILSGLEYPACFHWFYNRLARMTNLRELCLVSVKDPFIYDADREVTRELRFTVEEGLGRLERLKRLEVLDVEHLHHRIGVAEVQWMITHWPRLRVIRGLIFEEDAAVKGEEGMDVEMEGEEKGWSEGVRWLKMTRPDIELPVLEKRWKGTSLLDYPELVDEDL